jgi:hypothetical protein
MLDPGETNVPFLKRTVIDFGWLYLPFVILVITGASDADGRLADGLDGLAAGMTAFAAVALGGMCYITGHVKFSQYLQVPYIAGTGELTVFCAAVIRATLGFLWCGTAIPRTSSWGHRLAVARRCPGYGRGPDQARVLLAIVGDRLRGGSALGPDPGLLVQLWRTGFQDGAPPPPLRAFRMEGAASGRSFLDRAAALAALVGRAR